MLCLTLVVAVAAVLVDLFQVKEHRRLYLRDIQLNYYIRYGVRSTVGPLEDPDDYLN